MKTKRSSARGQDPRSVPDDGGVGMIGVEFCGTSIPSRSAGNAKIPETLAENPHFVFADSERKGYGVVELTPQRISITLRVVSDATRQDSGLETLARFSVQAGSPAIERN